MRLVLLFSLVSLAGCEAGKPPVRPEDLRGPRLTRAIPRPGLTLTHSDGRPLDFRADTRGTLTFLFFGYTHCPDVCPLHMANLAAALRELPEAQAKQVRVVFVTTDPERDTPERLTSWLANFDSTFIGARGSPQVLEAAQRSLGMPVASRDAQVPDSGGYTVSHGAHLWAFTPDDSAHVVYPMGMGREVLAADIPLLLRLWPAR
jgi:protein SCO1/2